MDKQEHSWYIGWCRGLYCLHASVCSDLLNLQQKSIESAFNQFADEDGEISLETLGKVG